jgi:hypothetical protein
MHETKVRVQMDNRTENFTAAFDAAVVCIQPHVMGAIPDCLPMTTAQDATAACTEAVSTIECVSTALPLFPPKQHIVSNETSNVPVNVEITLVQPAPMVLLFQRATSTHRLVSSCTCANRAGYGFADTQGTA